MQEYSQADQEGEKEVVEKFEKLIKGNQQSYFDVHQIESAFHYFHEHSYFEKAEAVLKMGLSQHPTSTSLLLKKSTLFIEQNKNSDALEILRYLQNVENTNAEVFLNIGLVYIRSEKKEEALEHFKTSIHLCEKEDIPEYIFEMGFNLNQEGYYKDAAKLLKYYYKRYPSNENILFELAYAYDKQNDIDNGIKAYNKLLDLNPYLENAWYNLGILHNKKENYKEAIEAYDFTIAIAPLLPEAYYNKANSLAQIGCYTEAIHNYVDYISYSYPTAVTYYYLGDCWENLKNYHYASLFFKLAVELDPDHIDALQALGRTSYNVQDYETSIYAFDKALDINPNSSELWRSLGKSYKKIKKAAEAKRCLKKALINKHEDTSSWIEMYQFLNENEKDFNPIPFLNLLLSKDQANGALHYLAAIIYYQKKNHKKALEHLVIARQLLPGDLELVLNEFPSLISMPEIANYINTQQ